MRLRTCYSIAAIALCTLSAGCSSTPAAKPSVTATTAPAVSYDRSCEKTALSQVAMDGCAAGEASELQNQLAQALQKDASIFGSAATVEAVQAAWIQYRDHECALEESTYSGGTIAPFIYGQCVVALTVQRIQEVREVIAVHARQ